MRGNNSRMNVKRIVQKSCGDMTLLLGSPHISICSKTFPMAIDTGLKGVSARTSVFHGNSVGGTYSVGKWSGIAL